MLDSATTRGFTGGSASGKPEFLVGERQQGTASRPTSARWSRWRRTTAGVLGFGAALAITILPNPAHAVDAKKVFSQRCSACHTFGKGIQGGPDMNAARA